MRLYAVVFFAFGLSCAAQDVLIRGNVRQYEADVPLRDATVHVSRNGHPIVTVECDSTGWYQVTLDVGQHYALEYRSHGRVPKNVVVDLSTTPKDDGGYGMVVDVRLFEPDLGRDVRFLQEPIGMAAYDSTSQNIAWDMEYTLPRMERLSELYPVQYTIDDSVPEDQDTRGN